MADEYVVQEVDEFTTGAGAEFWRVTMRRPDDEIVHHLFPKETLEWRAAEYGLDDPAEILDVILHSKFAEHDGKQFYDAESTTEAKANYLARAERGRRAVHVIGPKGKPNPLAVIVERHGMDPARVQAKREDVDLRRWQRHGGHLPDPMRGAAARADRALPGQAARTTPR